MVKIIGGLILVVILFFVAGVTGLLFWLWPTFWPNEQISINSSEVEQLRALRAAPKFYADDAIFYPGAVNVERRLLAERSVNRLIDSLVNDPAKYSKKSDVLALFKLTLAQFPTDVTEDMERLGGYLGQILETLQIQSSNELLNVRRYGFPYGWWLRA